MKLVSLAIEQDGLFLTLCFTFYFICDFIFPEKYGYDRILWRIKVKFNEVIHIFKISDRI